MLKFKELYKRVKIGNFCKITHKCDKKRQYSTKFMKISGIKKNNPLF